MTTAEKLAVNRLSSSLSATWTNIILQGIKWLGWQPKKKYRNYSYEGTDKCRARSKADHLQEGTGTLL